MEGIMKINYCSALNRLGARFSLHSILLVYIEQVKAINEGKFDK